MNKQEMATEALSRALNSDSVSNYDAIYDGFAAIGIPETDVTPRVNVFTYRAWQAKGRQVQRGQHGVKITTYIVCKEKDKETGTETGVTFRRPKTATVFHISQTEAA